MGLPVTETSSHSQTPNLARILGPGTAGLFEIAFFHPVDTTAKRLMSHRGPVVLPDGTYAQKISHVHNIILRGYTNASPWKQFISLYPGVGFAVSYKIAQRIYKFGGQPFIKDQLNDSYIYRNLTRMTSEKNSRVILDALAGVLVGVGELMLLPMDILKIKAQTNPEALAHRSLSDILLHNPRQLFAGASWTLMRNIPGSLALFGASSAVKEYAFDIKDNKPSLFAMFASSAVGSICSIVASSPFDVVKTRVQNQPFTSQLTGSQVVQRIIKQEGLIAFTRGLTPKLLTVGPKLICSFTAAQYFTSKFASMLEPEPEKHK